MKDFCMTWGKRIATKQMLLIAVLTLAAACVGVWLKQFPGFSLFGALIIALIIGMIIQFPIRAWYVKDDPERATGVKDAAGLISNKLLRLGIIMLGFRLNLQVLFTTGAKCLPLALGIVAVTVILTYAVARFLKVDPLLAILVACGTGTCGAAAVMGVSGSIKVGADRTEEKSNDEVIAVAIVAIMGTIFALVEIAVLPLLGLSQEQMGIVAGGSLHEIAHAIAAGEGLGATALEMATIMKLSRVLMLILVTIVVAIWWDRFHAEAPAGGKRKIAFPWFMLGFVAASVVTTLFLGQSKDVVTTLVDIATIFLGMAMAALGINVDFKAIARNGMPAFLASFLASIVLLALCIGIAVWLF
ncbi:YeiH family protein [Bifidobacterium cuniculi]|nr:putative sulfate exporter family transporter [Bifidobacterium cuniculi]